MVAVDKCVTLRAYTAFDKTTYYLVLNTICSSKMHWRVGGWGGVGGGGGGARREFHSC